MKPLALAQTAIYLLYGCTTSNADVVLLKTLTEPAHCAAPVHGACASCEAACPALKQALCIGGTSAEATPSSPAVCTKPATCSCL